MDALNLGDVLKFHGIAVEPHIDTEDSAGLAAIAASNTLDDLGE